MIRLPAAAALVVACGCAGPQPAEPPRDWLREAWSAYKQRYIQPDGYTIDPSRNSETISEAQGYALLRAVWMRDEVAFRTVFRWTEQHLKRPDGLYSWRWSAKAGGQVIDPNSATDADQEIALALILASHTFKDGELLTRAREVIEAIRTHARIEMGAGWFPAAGNWAASRRIANLSYFVPYAYAYFARIDPPGRWHTVTDAGYDLLAQSVRPPDARLIPDFIAVSASGAPAPLPPGSGLSSDFSSDAVRIYWRIAMDCRLNQRIRGCADLLRADQLAWLLGRDGVLFTRYAIDGTPLERVESMSFYGAALPYLLLHAPPTAQAITRSKLSEGALDELMSAPDKYYDANWVWFGMAAADGFINTAMPKPEEIAVR